MARNWAIWRPHLASSTTVIEPCTIAVPASRSSPVLCRSGRTALGVLLESARQPRWRIWAVRAPFERKDSLKRRGYRWCDGSDGRPRAWNVDVADQALESELTFLRGEIYRPHDVDIDAQRISAFERYSGRA